MSVDAQQPRLDGVRPGSVGVSGMSLISVSRRIIRSAQP
jgi:hypothetical protein